MILDATDVVVNFVPFNEDPLPGSQYVLIELTGTNTDSGIAEPVFEWTLADEDFTHIPGEIECGEIPQSIYDVRPAAQGDEFKANICFEVESNHMAEDPLLRLALFDSSESERFFALD